MDQSEFLPAAITATTVAKGDSELKVSMLKQFKDDHIQRRTINCFLSHPSSAQVLLLCSGVQECEREAVHIQCYTAVKLKVYGGKKERNRHLWWCSRLHVRHI